MEIEINAPVVLLIMSPAIAKALFELPRFLLGGRNVRSRERFL
jgi:hypothetical protein